MTVVIWTTKPIQIAIIVSIVAFLFVIGDRTVSAISRETIDHYCMDGGI
jgi:hypothetical protein